MYNFIVSVLFSMLFLSACGGRSTATDVSNEYTLPESMAHCTVSEIKENGSWRYLNVVHCPNSTSTSVGYKSGKSTRHVSIINQNPTSPIYATKAECEAMLPRNQSCVSAWVPEDIVDEPKGK